MTMHFECWLILQHISQTQKILSPWLHWELRNYQLAMHKRNFDAQVLLFPTRCSWLWVLKIFCDRMCHGRLPHCLSLMYERVASQTVWWLFGLLFHVQITFPSWRLWSNEWLLPDFHILSHGLIRSGITCHSTRQQAYPDSSNKEVTFAELRLRQIIV